MNDFFSQLLEQVRSAWQRYNAPQRALMVALPLLLLGAFAWLVLAGSQPRYRTLFTNLQQKDAGLVVEKLKAGGVPYRVIEGGSGLALEVPEEKVYDTRFNLASQGLPSGGGVGFEIFDKTSFGATDFNQKVNFQRALEGELSRTIGHLAEVSSARVHLAVPAPELYSSKEKPTRASVVLDLRPGAGLRADQIRGILHLVASSVEGLEARNVTLLDSHGNNLSEQVSEELAEESGNPASGPASGGGRLIKQTSGQLEVQRRFEHELQRRVASQLDKMLGPNRATVQVSAELKFDQVEQNSETYEPIVNNQGLARSVQRKSESSTGVSTLPGLLPGGVPGTESNIPGYQAAAGGASAANSSYSKTEETVNYELNKKVAKVVEAPGAVKRLSVAVMVDGLQPQQVDSIKAWVTAAVALDEMRGDKVVVENMPFDTSEKHAAEMSELQERHTELWLMLWKGIIVLLVVIFLLLFLTSILKPKVVRVQERLIREITRAGDAEGEEAAIPVDLVGRPSEASLEEQRKAQLRQQVNKLAREKPQAIALLIRRWLAEEQA